MIIKDTLYQATKKLTKKIPTASLDAEVLLSYVLKKEREFLYTYPEKKLSAWQEEKFKELISRRIKFEPIAYLTKHKEFYGLDFYVNKNVLIPRPETELLIEEILNYVKTKSRRCHPELVEGSRRLFGKLTIVDIGTGSGCIAITLAKQLPKLKIYAVDVSKAALNVAKRNAQAQSVKIDFKSGSLFEPIKDKTIDILVANLPYLTEQEISSAKNSPLYYEPRKALAGGKDGLQLYEELFRQIIATKNKPNLIIAEIGHRQNQAAKKLAKKYFPQTKIEIKKDLAGLNRILIIKKRSTA